MRNIHCKSNSLQISFRITSKRCKIEREKRREREKDEERGSRERERERERKKKKKKKFTRKVSLQLSFHTQILLHILYFLPADSLLSLSMVSRRFADMIQLDDIWNFRFRRDLNRGWKSQKHAKVKYDFLRGSRNVDF